MNICTRVAPSPTGPPHLGTAYIALFNYCFARSQNGKFILRMEDTDQARSSARRERQIIDALRWIGLDWDAGPDIGGADGPYRQSEREVYAAPARRLFESGHAFYCFATPEELEAMRLEQIKKGETPRYDGRALGLSPEDVQRRRAAGEPSVLRLKVPERDSCVVSDLLRGEVCIDWKQIDMQVLLKADGSPTYHFASVVDDHLMGVSHVIRGEEWLVSTPKHLLLYDYLGWEPPRYCHMPLLRNPNGSKLSKRRNPTSIFYYREQGYLPEAVLNYLGRCGWSMPDERERFSLAEMVEHFDLSRVSTSAPAFDADKLDWLNANWLRELDNEAWIACYTRWLAQRGGVAAVAGELKVRARKFSEVADIANFLLVDRPRLTAEAFETLPGGAEQARLALQFGLWAVEALDAAADCEDSGMVFAAFKQAAQIAELPLKHMMPPLFLAITGRENALPVSLAVAVLGADLSQFRLRTALELIGAPSKKKIKAWESARAALRAAIHAKPAQS